MLKKIKEEAWSYTLYEKGSKQFLSVLCGTIAMYETVIELNEDEKTIVRLGNIEKLVKAIRENTSQYHDRRITNFNPS